MHVKRPVDFSTGLFYWAVQEGALFTPCKSFASTRVWATPAFTQQTALSVFGAFSRAAIIFGFGRAMRFGFFSKSRRGGRQRNAKTQTDEQDADDFGHAAGTFRS
jgi:hypothetical protein